MHWSSMRRSVLIGAVALTTLGTAVTPASAIINGDPTTSGAPWAAYIDTRAGKCTGSLIGPQWVVTAAHCVADLAENGNDYTVNSVKPMSVNVGQTTPRDTGERRKVTQIELRRYRDLTGPDRYDDDIALLRLDTPVTATPLLLLPSAKAAKDGAALTLHGYGHTVPKDEIKKARSKVGTLRRTSAGENQLHQTCAGATDGIVCVRDTGDSIGALGDSGGPWTTQVDGQSLLALIFSGYVFENETTAWQYGESTYNEQTLDWLRSYLAIPAAVPGKIVRDPATAQAWLIDDDGYRRSIPDGGTFECLVAQGSEVSNLPRPSLDLMAARTAPATCSNGGGAVLVLGLEVEGDDDQALTEVLSAAGYEVTKATTVPADVQNFDQVWALTTYIGYSPDVQLALADYVRGGGSLMMNSEHSCCPITNESAEAILDDLLTVDVTVETVCASPCVAGADPLNDNAYGNISSQPNQGVTLLTDAVGRYLGVPDANVLIYHDGQAGATVWGPEHMKNGAGKLVTVGDSNWSDNGRLQSSNTLFTQNVASYLGS